jgi:hypothetical protein
MLDFIPHYFTVIDPLALFVWLAVVGMIVVGWAVCMISDRRRK